MIRKIEYFFKLNPYIAFAVAAVVALILATFLVWVWKRSWQIGLLLVVLLGVAVCYYGFEWSFWQGIFIYESPGRLGTN